MLRVAGLQMDPVWEDPQASCQRADRLLASAAADGAGLAVLPEMFATGFSMRADLLLELAGITRAFLIEAARRHGLWICAGLVLPGVERPRNAALFVDPDGRERFRYDKVHPFSLAGEPDHYEAGRELSTVTIDGLRLTPMICYDLRFPEPFRARAAETDGFIVLASWPAARREHWRVLLHARAVENQAYVLGVNRVGEGDGLRYAGDTMLVDPSGETLAAAADQAAVVAGTLSADRVAELRARFGFLADRRRALYRVFDADSG